MIINRSKTKKTKGFTLTELLVVMAIIAAIMGLALASLRILTRNGRDAKRVETINLLKIEFEKVYQARGRYPNGNNDVFLKEGTWIVCYDPPSCSNSKNILAEDIHLVEDKNTTEKSTLYCYFTGNDSGYGYNVSGEYVMGVKKESGEWAEVGTSTSLTCEEMEKDGNLDLMYLPNGNI